MKQGDFEADVLSEVAPGGRGDSARRSVRLADCAAAREAWETMYSQWPEGPPHQTDRKKAAAEADAIRAANPGPFPDSTDEIRRSRDADWGE